MNATLNYYAENAQDFFDSTFDKRMEEVYQKFLPYLPENAHLLDAGCGSGRDSRHFLSLGFSVDALDASTEMAALASDYIGQLVKCHTFDEVQLRPSYDGIWASASLLHLPYSQLPKTFERLSQALKDGGIFYASFKHGEKEYIKAGRHFTPLNEERVQALFEKLDRLQLQTVWLTPDVREERKGEMWLNLLAKKRTDDNG